MLYFDFFKRQLISNIDWYTMIICLDKNQDFAHNYQNIMIMKELWDVFRGKGTIFTDVLFILENIRINCQMDAGKF